MMFIAKCTWRFVADDLGQWNTGCGESFVLHDCTPEKIGMRYCCYCGKRLKQEEISEEENADRS